MQTLDKLERLDEASPAPTSPVLPGSPIQMHDRAVDTATDRAMPSTLADTLLATTHGFSVVFGPIGAGAGIGILSALTQPGNQDFIDPSFAILIASIALLCCVFGVASWLTAFLTFQIWLYRAWSAVPRKYNNLSPGAAAGFLCVPFLNAYWMFRVIPGLSLMLKKTLRDKKKAISNWAGFWPGLIACIFAIPLVLFPPLLLIFAPVVVLPFSLIFMNLVNSARYRI